MPPKSPLRWVIKLLVILPVIVFSTGCQLLEDRAHLQRANSSYSGNDEQLILGQSFEPNSKYEWLEQHPVLGYSLIATAIIVPIVVVANNQHGD